MLTTVLVARIVQKLGKPHSTTRMEGSVKRLELLANRFFGAGPRKGPAHDPIVTEVIVLPLGVQN